MKRTPHVNSADRIGRIALVVAVASFGCRGRRHASVHEVAGVRMFVERGIGAVLSSSELTVSHPPSGNDPVVGAGLFSFRYRDHRARGPIAIEVILDAKRATFAEWPTELTDPIAALRHDARSFDGNLTISLEPSAPAVMVHLVAQHLDTLRALGVRVRVPRVGAEIAFADGAPYAPDAPFPITTTPYVVIGGDAPLVIVAPTGLEVEGDGSFLVAKTPSLIAAYGTADATLAIAAAPTMVEALALGARLSKSAARRGATIAIEPRDRATGAPIAARVLVEAQPVSAPTAPTEALVLDRSRDAEPSAPLIDALAPRTLLSVPAGHYVLRATHGIGWSIAKSTLDLKEGESVRAPLYIEEEAPHEGWIGCDLHVHARGSADARAVSYEDRVRSLVAVGVDCAAATEHDHVGDHGPAARALGVDAIFRALTGVELTTGFPNFGHFNVYPWPSDAPIPATHGTTPQALFAAVHAMPGSFIFQLNHPRLHTGDGVSIGYLDVASVDPQTGEAKGAYAYLRNYDALEIFNGYHLHEIDKVLELTEEWLRMLDRGDIHVATGNSDSHNLSFPWAGFPRTLVRVGPSFVQEGRPTQRIVDALTTGRATVTSGPVVSVVVRRSADRHPGTTAATTEDATIGDDARAEGSVAEIEVGLTSWLTKPTLRLHLGADSLGELVLTPDPKRPHRFHASYRLQAVTRRRPLVAVVRATLIDDVRGMTGMNEALAVTNPVWLVP
ncbi:MAG: hypothetical protein NVS3B20_14630 [Polyangiales bacterium]